MLDAERDHLSQPFSMILANGMRVLVSCTVPLPDLVPRISPATLSLLCLLTNHQWDEKDLPTGQQWSHFARDSTPIRQCELGWLKKLFLYFYSLSNEI